MTGSARPLFLALLLTASFVARGEESGVKPRKKKTMPPVPRTGSSDSLQYRRDVARYAVAAVVKVVEAGVVFEEKNRPQLPQDRNNSWRMQQFGVRAQRVRCEVTESIRGLKENQKQIEILVRHLDIYGAQRRLQRKHPKRQMPELKESIAEAALFPGEKYLVLLAVDENLEPGEGRKGPVYSTMKCPVFGAPGALVKIYRAMASRIRLYSNPPVATGEQLAAAKKHLGSLGSTAYGTRERAHQELLKIGPAIMEFIRAAKVASKDLEVRLRCEKLLDDMKPLPGGSPEEWAGDFVIEKVKAEKEEDRDKEEDREKEEGDEEDAGAAGRAPAK